MKSFLALLLFPLLLLGCSSSSDLPAISDSGRLSSDCQELLGTSATDTIDASQWPDSIKSLKPLPVIRNGNTIYITTFAQTGVGARGYAVGREKPQPPDHYVISSTSYPNIYRFEVLP